MCGIFGAIGENLDTGILKKIAREADRRGPQAYGIAWMDDGRIRRKLESHEIDPERCFTGIRTDTLIGNCRLSTSGSYRNAMMNQPVQAGETAVSHNGNIRNCLQAALTIGAVLQTDCDSEIMCHLINRYGIEETVRRLEGEAPMAFLVLQESRITAYRSGQPLYVLQKGGCYYFCSRSIQDAEQVPENRILVYGG